MPTLAEALTQMNPLFDALVAERGRDVEFVADRVTRVTVRVVEAASWTPTELPTGEVVQQDFDLICRDNELVAAGVTHAPRRPDYFLVDGIKRFVEAATPMHVSGTLFGWRVSLSG